MDTKELLWKLLIEAYNSNVKSNILSYIKPGMEPDDKIIQELVDCITNYIDKSNGMLGTAISLNLQKDNLYIPAAEFKELKNLRQKFSQITSRLSEYHNGYLFALAILATLLNWKDLFYACEWELEYNAQDDLNLDINKEDIKDCIKYLIDNGQLNNPEFNAFYNDTLKQYRLD